MHESESACFLAQALPSVQNPLHNYCSKKKLECFGQYLKKSKKLFRIVYSNLARKGSGVYIHARVQIFSPNALY